MDRSRKLQPGMFRWYMRFPTGRQETRLPRTYLRSDRAHPRSLRGRVLARHRNTRTSLNYRFHPRHRNYHRYTPHRSPPHPRRHTRERALRKDWDYRHLLWVAHHNIGRCTHPHRCIWLHHYRPHCIALRSDKGSAHRGHPSAEIHRWHLNNH